MKRIDPNAVAAWYDAHPEIKPIREQFVRLTAGELTGCCGLTSVLIDAVNDQFRPSQLEHEGTWYGAVKVADIVGLDHDYAYGFALGWDASPTNQKDFATWREGHKDGMEAWTKSLEASTASGRQPTS